MKLFHLQHHTEGTKLRAPRTGEEEAGGTILIKEGTKETGPYGGDS